MAKIKPNELAKYLEKRVNDSHKKAFEKWQDKAKVELTSMIEESLDAGKSPVQGEGAFQKYSPNYKKADRTVNLKVTGKMRRSIKFRKIKDGLSLWYSSPIAKYHNGQGRVDRFMIPTKEGQKFTRKIRASLARIYKKLFKI